MKKYCILLFTILGINITLSQITIDVEKSNGLYLIPCKVNGIPMKFIFDTGASEVTISATEALFLIKNGLIDNKDFIGSNKYQTASGEILTGTKVNIKKIQVAGLILENISATIVHNLEAPLLLGQNVLSQLGKITLENNQLKIENISEYSGSKDRTTDCIFESLIPFKIGMNKFNLSIIDAKDAKINTIPKFDDLNANERQSLENATKQFNSGWEKMPYLDEKVFRSKFDYYNSHNSCLGVNEFHYHLKLVDDYLYKIGVFIEYKEIEKTLEIYNLLLNNVPDEYKFKATKTISNSNTNEKIGEGTRFYKESTEKRDKTKPDYYEITYSINFEKIYDDVEKKYKLSSIMKNCEIEIAIVNLHNTKLTNQQY